MTQVKCLIPANPDIAGIGVRAAVYIQAFLALIPGVLKIAEDIVIDDLNETSLPPPPATPDQQTETTPKYVRTTVQWDDVLAVITPNLILGSALIISSVVQAHTFGLTVYHALIVLNLSWMISFSVSPSVFISQNDKKRDKEPQAAFVLIGLFHIFYLVLTAGFALWLFVTINHFDKTGTDCTSSTIFYLFGDHVPADSPHFRRFWLAIYSILAIPFINMIFVLVVFGAIYLPALIAVVPLTLVIAIIARHQIKAVFSSRGLRMVGMMSTPVAMVSPLVLVIILTEKMILSNTVDAGESSWTFGQTLALLIAVPPTLGVAKRVWKTHLHIRQMTDSLPESKNSPNDPGKIPEIPADESV